MVSGERRLRGTQPGGNLVVRACFWICQGREPSLGGSVGSAEGLVDLELGLAVAWSAARVWPPESAVLDEP